MMPFRKPWAFTKGLCLTARRLLTALLVFSLCQLALANDFTTLTEAATEGDPLAQFELGWRLETGTGVDTNETDARLWYSRAAEQGHIESIANLGSLLYEGRGGKTDYPAAFAMMTKAANAGLALAQYNLAVMYMTGHGTVVDESEAARWMESAARNGHAPAQQQLADFYQRGYGLVQDLVNALTWALIADTAVSDNASNALRKSLEDKLEPAAIVEAEKRANALDALLSR